MTCIASQDAFDVLHQVFVAHEAHAVIVRRTLAILSSAVRSCMAAGLEAPPEVRAPSLLLGLARHLWAADIEHFNVDIIIVYRHPSGYCLLTSFLSQAERAFDLAGGLPRLAHQARKAAARRDAVVLEAALRAIAGVRLHSKERVEQAGTHVLPLLLEILTTGSAPMIPPPQDPKDAQVGGAQEHVHATAADALVGADEGAAVGPLVHAFSVASAAAALVALYRVAEALHTRGLTLDRPGTETSDNGSRAAAPRQLPPAVRALQGTMQSAVLHASQPAALPNDDRLPLWECVVLAGAISALKSRRAQAKRTPWRRSGVYGGGGGDSARLLAALLDELPEPPPALVARGALLTFQPGLLRVRLAQGERLEREVRIQLDVASLAFLSVSCKP